MAPALIMLRKETMWRVVRSLKANLLKETLDCNWKAPQPCLVLLSFSHSFRLLWSSSECLVRDSSLHQGCPGWCIPLRLSKHTLFLLHLPVHLELGLEPTSHPCASWPNYLCLVWSDGHCLIIIATLSTCSCWKSRHHSFLCHIKTFNTGNTSTEQSQDHSLPSHFLAFPHVVTDQRSPCLKITSRPSFIPSNGWHQLAEILLFSSKARCDSFCNR